MEDLQKILLHRKRLNAVLKQMSTADFEKVVKDVNALFEIRLAEEAEMQQARQEKLERLEKIKSLMDQDGLTLEDLVEVSQPETTKSAETRTVEPKYRVIDANGEEHLWTGRGRTPKVFQAHFDQGNSKESCLIAG